MIGCIPRERGLEERVDRGGEAFNTCGTVLPLSIKRISWITISTPCRKKRMKKQERSPLRLLKKYLADPAIARDIQITIRSFIIFKVNYLLSLILVTEMKNLAANKDKNKEENLIINI